MSKSVTNFLECKLMLTMSLRGMLLFQTSIFRKYKNLFQMSIYQIVNLIE